MSGSGFPPFSSPPPGLDTSNNFGTFDQKQTAENKKNLPPKPPPKVPSLLDMNIPRPSSMDPQSKQKGSASAWLDPLLPQGRQGNASEGSGVKNDQDRSLSGKFNKERNSKERETSRRRSRSRDRGGGKRTERGGDRSRRERSGEREKRSSVRDWRRRTRSRSRDRRRQRDERRQSQASASSQDSGVRRDRGQDSKGRHRASEERKKGPDTRISAAEDKINDGHNDSERRESQEDRDNLMLCFYEGEDCMDDPGDPDLNYDQSAIMNNQKDIATNDFGGKEVKNTNEGDAIFKPSASFVLPVHLFLLAKVRDYQLCSM